MPIVRSGSCRSWLTTYAKLFEHGIRFGQRILQLFARRFIGHDLCVADQNVFCVAERIHEAIGEELGSVLTAVPANVRGAAGLLRLLHL